MDEMKLTTKEKTLIATETILNLIPYAGGSLATLIFGPQNEKRLKRVESFFEEISNMIANNEIVLASNLYENQEAFAAIFEEVVERIQREHTEGKREFLKNFFSNVLGDEQINYDRSMTFLRILGELTCLQSELLKSLYRKRGELIYPRDIYPNITKNYEAIAALYHLQNSGLVISATHGYIMMADFTPTIASNNIEISSFGVDFVNYVLSLEEGPE